MTPGASPEIELTELEERLALNAPRGSVTSRPGVPEGLRDLPARFGLRAIGPMIDSRGPGAAVMVWSGPQFLVSLFASTVGPEHLRRTLLLAGIRSTHGPSSLLQPGNPQLGDAS